MNWRGSVVGGSLLLMEALWTYALLAFVLASLLDSNRPGFIAVLAVVFVSFGLSRLLQTGDLSLGIIRIWGTTLSLLIFYAIVRIDFFGDWRLWDFGWANDLVNHMGQTMRANQPAVFGIPFLFIFWVRGLLRGQQDLSFDNVLATFGVGILIIAFVEVFHDAVGAPSLVGKLPVPYVAIGLIAVSLAHASQADYTGGRPLGQTWLIAAGTSVVLLGVLALVFALFDLGATRDALIWTGETVGPVLRDAAYYLVWPVAKFAEGSVWLLGWVLRSIFGSAADIRPIPPPAANECVQNLVDSGLTPDAAREMCLQQEQQVMGASKFGETLVRVLTILIVSGIVIFILWYLFDKFQPRRRPSDVKESTYVEGRLASDVSDFFGNLLNRFRPGARTDRAQLDAIRRLYFEVVATGERRGLKRPVSQTPREFAPQLDASFHSEAPGHITDAFDDARYGSISQSDERVRQLRAEWENLGQSP